MKLSTIKGDRVLDVIADLIVPLSNLAQDKAVANLFRKQKLPQNTDKTAYAVARLKKYVPSILKNHKADVVAIMATLSEKTPDAYAAEMTIPSLLSDVVDLINDPDFAALFFEQVSQTTSGSASVTTEAPTASEPL